MSSLHVHLYIVVPHSWLSWFATTISRTYGRYIELVDGGYKLTYNWGVPHCMYIFKCIYTYIYIYCLTVSITETKGKPDHTEHLT